MDDRFLHELREEPRPEFAAELRDRLSAREGRRGVRFFPVPAMAAAAILIAGTFAFPSVRASAQNLLDFFRVRRFAAVEFDASRIEKLQSLRQENQMLVFESHEVIRQPGPAQTFATAEEAGAAADLKVRRPGFLPQGFTADSLIVEGAGEFRLAVSSDRLQDLLDKLDLKDVRIPAHLDGEWVQVRKPQVVVQNFRSERSQVFFEQARGPEVSVPSGVDLQVLGELALRILGLDSGEARRMARATDWRTTLLVPVPLNASSFRQVTIRGQSGLMITTAGVGDDGERHREGTIVLWTDADQFFALKTNLGPTDALQIADSVQ